MVEFEALRARLEDSEDLADMTEDLVRLLEAVRATSPEARRMVDAKVRELATDEKRETYQCETATLRQSFEEPAEWCEEPVLWGHEACERHDY